jgi:signal transduction histidine kinase
MLGRQQIAGIPTAIHELFKNAHDAYAHRVEVDFFRSDKLLIIRDDGYGMTKEDFESRWLTLGTESKIGDNQPDKDVWKQPDLEPRRPIMGEKGIGRLAIAAVGPQVLVLTRAKRRDGIKPLVASIVHWGFFELPGINLDSIDIPVEEVTGTDLPNEDILDKLIGRIRENITELGSAVPWNVADRIHQDLDLFRLDLAKIDGALLGPRLGNGGCGTHFYIRPTYEILSADIDRTDEDTASPLEKMLLGFSNTMMPERDSPVIVAEFRDHSEDGVVDELIGGSSFFTPEEFESADHHIDGIFDDHGQFAGSISVYREQPVEHIIHWPGASGNKTDCGTFRIKFAYVQGDMKDSKLPPDIWAELSAKLNKIGGLYVYRDGIRILPYGNSDYDFLNIERRRTKSAQDWFFSYRRIFGAIEISAADNFNLVEKAGREGFRTNAAYREFVSILENFFERLAIDFFRPTSQYGDAFNATKQQLQRDAELLKKREKMTRARRKEFGDRLQTFFADIEKGIPSAQAAAIRAQTAERLAVIKELPDAEQAVQAILSIESDARESIVALEKSAVVLRPRSVGLTKSQRSDWNAYLRNTEKLQQDVIVPLQRDVATMIDEVVSAGKLHIDRRKRILAALEDGRKASQSRSIKARRELQEEARKLASTVDDTLKNCISEISSDIERTFIAFEKTDTSSSSETELREKQRQWEGEIASASDRGVEILEGLRDQLASLTASIKEGETLDATTAALETTSEAYREQLDTYVELAQVGMALGVVQHEFVNTIKGIRNAIRKLKPWAAGTPELRTLYDNLRVGFDHLDGYLKLFTPLSRRLNREAVDLSGEEVRRYLLEVFDERLRRHHIAIEATSAFDGFRIHAFPSTLLASFVNVVDNAIYWISSDADSQKIIRLDADTSGFSIWNGGPGIDSRVADRIFEFGETTKVGGRGIGLYLSRQSLRREGLDLTLEAVGKNSHPMFRIRPTVGELNDELNNEGDD